MNKKFLTSLTKKFEHVINKGLDKGIETIEDIAAKRLIQKMQKLPAHQQGTFLKRKIPKLREFTSSLVIDIEMAQIRDKEVAHIILKALKGSQCSLEERIDIMQLAWDLKAPYCKEQRKTKTQGGPF